MKTILNSTRKLAGLQQSMFMALLIASSTLSAQAQDAAPVQCKGLENAACANNEDCSWVQGYERKDGRLVNAFCRTKAKPKSTTSTTSSSSSKS